MTVELATPTPGVEVNDPRGRTAVDPSLFQQPRTRIIMSTGQSMLGNWADCSPVPFDPSHPCYELNIFDGLIRPCDGGPISNMNQGPHQSYDQFPQRLSVLDYWGKYLCAQGKNDRVLVCGLNIGGTPAAHWAPGTGLFNRAVLALRMLESMGLTPTEWVHAIGHGDRMASESQHLSVEMTSARFAAHTVAFIDGMRAAGYAGKILLGLGCWQSIAVEAKRIAVVTGQQMAAEATGVTLGANDDAWITAQMRPDGCHWSEAGRWASFFAVNASHPEYSWTSFFTTMP
ncbi:hypothetical protein FVW20_09485 [Desulfovibrio oxamicus]|uniref:Sialate O-acetylesterase domain-containing protein n=1 Tax=Nitratidesulfovibrio oxamicus TaxID=32016 RepID=A0ABS0J484_9BACT|nr:hypothetical protein [Nitratidesulfovibrio oxamicus]MBG3877241.1 hypothetical protein [Nitratidesulfovibrio oxamicus]